MEWFDPVNRERPACPHRAQFVAYLRIIWRSPISAYQRVRCLGELARWLIVYRRVMYMSKDLWLALLWCVRFLLPRPEPRVTSGGEGASKEAEW